MRLLKVISLIGTGIFVTGFGVAHAAQACFQCLIAPPSKIPVSIDVSVEIQYGQTRGRYQMQSDVKGAISSIGVADEITNSVGDKFYRLTWWTVAGPAYLVVNEKTGAYIHKVRSRLRYETIVLFMPTAKLLVQRVKCCLPREHVAD